jgi:hypothetical protein
MSNRNNSSNSRGQRDGAYDRKHNSDWAGIIGSSIGIGGAYSPPRDSGEKRSYDSGYHNGRYP